MADNLTASEFAALRHWSDFGQMGEPSNRRVTSSEWTNHPFAKPITSPWNQPVPRTELSKLLNGFSPRAMEDKWFVYADGPDAQGCAAIHMFRSWTGYKMAEVKLQISIDEDGEFAEADSHCTEIVWESDSSRRKNQTEEGAKAMVKEICHWCMQVSLP